MLRHIPFSSLLSFQSEGCIEGIEHCAKKFSIMDFFSKLKVHKTLRGRPVSLLNLLVTFNLRPVSRGYSFRVTIEVAKTQIHERI